nr:myb-like protein U isoform X2 [Drosophila kikkawai]XP_017030825.1 myb-like protein U isoform X2 [Drosophila kikkawai]XP_041630712.1 myb-like protein U isoform X2 [Drosophila kikkawai]
MEKTPRYTQRERNMVLSYAAQYKDVIENKRTDAESNRKKDEVWLQIAKDFNSKVYHQRSAKQLRQLYKNMKLLLKKDLCGEDKSNHSFMDLLNTLSQQESVAQYIAEQLSPEGAGGGKQGGPGVQGNGHHGDDFDDSKVGLYIEGMDTDVIVIKSETISDNEQTDNGMDCLDDDDDDDCLSPKAPEVCLEEEDDVLFPTDLRQLQVASSGPGGVNSSSASSSCLPGNNNNNNNNGGSLNDPLRRAAASSPVCSTKTSASSSGSYVSTSKPDITIQTVGHIRVGSFANINKTPQNGNGASSSSGASGISLSNGITSGSNGSVLPLTAEQVQQHTLLNGLGLSAVNPPQSLQAAINVATAFVSATSSSVAAAAAGTNRRTPPTLQLPRLQRGNNNNNNNNAAATSVGNGNTNSSSGLHSNANGVQLLLNGNHHHQQQQQQQHQHHSHHHPHLSRDKTGGVAIGAAGSFNGYNGLAVTVPCGNLNTSSGAGSGSGISSANSSGINLVNNTAGSGEGTGRGVKRPHQDLMDSLKIEEAQRKIDLLNAQTDYWLTLTRKINSQEGGGPFSNPACPCHFPGASFLSPAVVQAAAAAAAASASSSSAAAAVASSSSGSANVKPTQDSGS